MNTYVFDRTGDRPWDKQKPPITKLITDQLKTPSKNDLLIIHKKDYDSISSEFNTDDNKPYILWITGGTPGATNELKEHFYKYSLPHKTNLNHPFWNCLKSFIDHLGEKGIAKWELLYCYNTPNYLIALNLLCQGICIAKDENEKKKLPKGVTVNVKELERTKKQKWWTDVLGKDFKEKIETELASLTEDKNIKEPIIELLKAIENCQIQEETFKKILKEANNALKKFFNVNS